MSVDRVVPRERRILIIGGALCAVILCLGRGLPRLRDLYSSERANAQELAHALTRARMLVRSGRETGQEVMQRSSLLDSLRRALFLAPSWNASAAAAAAYLSRTARAARVEVSSMQLTADTNAVRGHGRIGLAVSGRGDIAGLMRLVTSIEGGAKALRIAAINVSQPDVVGRVNAPEILSFQLSIQALSARSVVP